MLEMNVNEVLGKSTKLKVQKRMTSIFRILWSEEWCIKEICYNGSMSFETTTTKTFLNDYSQNIIGVHRES